MAKNISIQDYIVNELRKNKIKTNVYLVNGTILKNSIITGFDSFTIILSNQNKQKIVYKHAISTLEPLKPINLNNK